MNPTYADRNYLTKTNSFNVNIAASTLSDKLPFFFKTT